MENQSSGGSAEDGIGCVKPSESTLSASRNAGAASPGVQPRRTVTALPPRSFRSLRANSRAHRRAAAVPRKGTPPAGRVPLSSSRKAPMARLSEIAFVCVLCQDFQEGTNPSQTNGRTSRVQDARPCRNMFPLRAHRLFGYHRGVPLGWCDRPCGQSSPDVLTADIIPYC